MRMRSGLVLSVVMTGLALAGCQQSADPRLKTATPEALQERVRSTCQSTQSKIQNVSLEKVARGCGCYATKTMKSLSPAELEEFRSTGVFGASGRDKALQAIDVCRLQRPA